MSWAVWITGPPGSGKSTLARAAARQLGAAGFPVRVLELDEIRKAITPAPTYSEAEREVVYRALVVMASLLADAQRPVIIDATAHRRRWRDLARAAIPRFAEVQLVCSPEVCRERERTRPAGHAPRGIYARAGKPGATVPGVDVPYEPALAAELVIDTSAQPVAEGAARIVAMARELALGASAIPAARPAGWAIWITGRPGSGKSSLAARVAESLSTRGIAVRVLEFGALSRVLLEGSPESAAGQEIAHRALAYAAKLLAEAGVGVVVDATAPRRVWREAARALIPRFAEVQLLCPTEICIERERARRWRLCASAYGPPARVAPAGTPDIGLGYEESLTPELVIRTDVHDLWSAAQQILYLVARLNRMAAAERLEPERRAL
ncbi:MAG TPA: adenylyl-sulfate kinase [Methylomirabilota bacterium]|nr:adenylyl-sulfate kinase [Methylomirabilota bacterium]